MESFQGPRGNRSAAKQFLRTNFNWKKSFKFEEYFVLRVGKYANVLAQRNDISTFDSTCTTVSFRKQLNSLLKLKAVNLASLASEFERAVSGFSFAVKLH